MTGPVPKSYSAAPAPPIQEAFLQPTHYAEKLGTVAKKIGSFACAMTLALGSLVRIDSAVNPLWEAGLGRPDARIERIYNDIQASDTLVTIATTPGFNANYDDMAQAKKTVAHEYNARLVFARNGNKNVKADTIALRIFEDMPKPRKNRFGEDMQESILVLDGHSMGGKTALYVAAWFTKHYPDISIKVVLDSSPYSTLDIQGFAAQSVVRGLSVGAPRKSSPNSSFTIGPGARLMAETVNRLSEEPLRVITDKRFVMQTLADKFRNLGANNQPLGNSALADQADIINTPLSQDVITTLVNAGVVVVRLSPDRDTTIHNASSVAAFAQVLVRIFAIYQFSAPHMVVQMSETATWHTWNDGEKYWWNHRPSSTR
ncbi:hypothetical protein IPL68_03015 [Candidatus Saccharibacteria bacterium]|nr:MAG: hypothetical protein IPL68_03015 [Candidatus Saccharibacteria bacterium]